MTDVHKNGNARESGVKRSRPLIAAAIALACILVPPVLALVFLPTWGMIIAGVVSAILAAMTAPLIFKLMSAHFMAQAGLRGRGLPRNLRVATLDEEDVMPGVFWAVLLVTSLINLIPYLLV